MNLLRYDYVDNFLNVCTVYDVVIIYVSFFIIAAGNNKVDNFLNVSAVDNAVIVYITTEEYRSVVYP